MSTVKSVGKVVLVTFVVVIALMVFSGRITEAVSLATSGWNAFWGAIGNVIDFFAGFAQQADNPSTAVGLDAPGM